MSDEVQYPKRWSDIEIIFLDGEVKTYRVGVGASFARHLAKQTGETGILTILCGPKTHSMPVTNIREWNLTEVEGENP